MLAKRHAILVTFKLKAGKAEEFKKLILLNAEASVRHEAECYQFHVTQMENNSDTFILYEIYATAASIKIHTAQPHYKTFINDSKPLVESVTIEPLTVWNPLNQKEGV